MQVKANALFKRSLPKRLREKPQDDVHESALRHEYEGTPPSSNPSRPRSPIRRAAGLAQRGIAVTVRTARTQRRRAVTILSPGRAAHKQGHRQQNPLPVQRKLRFEDDVAREEEAVAAEAARVAEAEARRAEARRAADKRKGAAATDRSPSKRKKKAKKSSTARPSANSTDPARDCAQQGYRPLGPIAAGAFSTIRHARVETGNPRLSAGFDVAIKTWSVALSKKDAANAYNRDTELATLRRAALRPHPHVANLLSVLEGPVYTHAVLEYCAGGSLLRHLQRLQTSKGGHQTKQSLAPNAPPSALSGGMELGHTRSVARQVLSALAFLHSLSITHRDVKPANVLFTDVHRHTVKLCDFGFATLCPPGSKLRMRCGTPIYNAPELVRGNEYYGPPVDVWAFGAMLFEMVHGKPAFHGHTLSQVEQRIRTGQHLPFDSEVPAEARALIGACLTANPTQRISAPAALVHPWLAIGTPPTPPAAPVPLAATTPPTTSDLSSLMDPCDREARTASGGSTASSPDVDEAPTDEPAFLSSHPFLSRNPALALRIYHSRVGQRSQLSKVEPALQPREPLPGRTVV